MTDKTVLGLEAVNKGGIHVYEGKQGTGNPFFVPFSTSKWGSRMRASLFVQPSRSLVIFWIPRFSIPAPSLQPHFLPFFHLFLSSSPPPVFWPPLCSAMASFHSRSNNLDCSKGALLLRHLSSAEHRFAAQLPRILGWQTALSLCNHTVKFWGMGGGGGLDLLN